MAKISSKIALPIILSGLFAIVVFVAAIYQNLNAGFYIILLLFAVYVFSFGFSIGKRLESPFEKLLARAKDINRGDLDSRVFLDTKDQIEELAKIFNEIAEKLQQSQAQADVAEKSVDIKVRARTQAMEETIVALEQKIQNRTIELQRKIEELESMQKEAEELKKKKEIKK